MNQVENKALELRQAGLSEEAISDLLGATFIFFADVRTGEFTNAALWNVLASCVNYPFPVLQ